VGCGLRFASYVLRVKLYSDHFTKGVMLLPPPALAPCALTMKGVLCGLREVCFPLPLPLPQGEGSLGGAPNRPIDQSTNQPINPKAMSAGVPSQSSGLLEEVSGFRKVSGPLREVRVGCPTFQAGNKDWHFLWRGRSVRSTR